MRAGMIVFVALIACGVASVSAAPWYETATADNYCGFGTPALEAAAKAEFLAAWNKAFPRGKACGDQTGEAIFGRLKQAQLDAAKPAPDLNGFAALAKACSAELTGRTDVGFGLWSGGYTCSKVASGKYKVLTLETTPFGSVVDGFLSYPHTEALAKTLGGAWKKCAGKLWNALSVEYVSQMSGTVWVFFRYAGEESVLYQHELPALKKLFDKGTVVKVKFDVVYPDDFACGVYDAFHTEVVNQREDLQKTLVDVATRFNKAHEKDPAITKIVVPKAPPRGAAFAERMAHMRQRRASALQPL